jgi:hypothetical protein
MNAAPTTKRISTMRKVGWLSVASMLALALLAPSAGVVNALSGAVYTSNFDGSSIDENIYAAKSDVYLTGGPCNGGSHLDAGSYYFEVDSPNGVLLSSDAVGKRLFTVGADGFISTADASHIQFPVNCTPSVVGITVQLLPYLDTPNSGGEYKLTVATASSVEACAGFDAASSSFQICNGADQKSDNFKVGATASPIVTEAPTPSPTVPPTTPPTNPPTTPPTNPPTTPPTNPPTTPPTVPPTTPPTVPPTAPPTAAPTATPTQVVLAETGVPTVTLPPTDGLSGTSGMSGDGWRILLIVAAGLLATVLVLTPSRTAGRRR